MTLSELIREYRAEHDISMAEFAKRCGVSKAYVGFLEKGENPRTHQPIAPSIQTLRNLAQGMHMDFNTLVRTVNTEVIVNASEETLNSQLESQTKTNTDSLPDFPGVGPVKRVMIPHYGNIACGKPITMQDEPEMLAEDTDRTDVDFTLMAKGDSMIGVRVMDGDKLFIKEFDGDFVNGEIYVVAVDDESTLKRVYKTEDTVTLVSENPKYPPMVYKESDAVNIRILGRVVFFQGRP